MIIRILGEGTFDVAESAVPCIDELYGDVVRAVRAGDRSAFELALPALLGEVRLRGTAIGTDRLGSFDALLPGKEHGLDDARIVFRIDAQLRAGVVPL